MITSIFYAMSYYNSVCHDLLRLCNGSVRQQQLNFNLKNDKENAPGILRVHLRTSGELYRQIYCTLILTVECNDSKRLVKLVLVFIHELHNMV